MLIILEQKSQKLCLAIEQLSERQDLLAARLEKMWILQEEAPDKFHEKIFLEGFRGVKIQRRIGLVRKSTGWKL